MIGKELECKLEAPYYRDIGEGEKQKVKMKNK